MKSGTSGMLGKCFYPRSLSWLQQSPTMASSETDAVCWRRAWFVVLEWSLGTEEGTSWIQLIRIRRGDCELTGYCRLPLVEGLLPQVWKEASCQDSLL